EGTQRGRAPPPDCPGAPPPRVRRGTSHDIARYEQRSVDAGTANVVAWPAGALRGRGACAVPQNPGDPASRPRGGKPRYPGDEERSRGNPVLPGQAGGGRAPGPRDPENPAARPEP